MFLVGAFAINNCIIQAFSETSSGKFILENV
jgi:hypothetical protein